MSVWQRWALLLDGFLAWFDRVTGVAPPRGVDPVAEGWRRRREELLKQSGTRSQPTYDPYPDTPQPTPRMKLVIISGRFMERVDLNGYSLDDFYPLQSLHDRRQRWFLERVQAARERLQVRLATRALEVEARREQRADERARRAAIADREAFLERLAKAHREAERTEPG